MSISWRLFNVDTGDATMQLGRMDVGFDNGGAAALRDPEAIVQQRIEKCSIEPQGSNPFLEPWGSLFSRLFGEKLVPQEIAREIGSSTRLMVDGLIAEQNRVRLRVPLDPRECILRLAGTNVSFGPETTVVVNPTIISEAGVATTASAGVR